MISENLCPGRRMQIITFFFNSKNTFQDKSRIEEKHQMTGSTWDCLTTLTPNPPLPTFSNPKPFHHYHSLAPTVKSTLIRIENVLWSSAEIHYLKVWKGNSSPTAKSNRLLFVSGPDCFGSFFRKPAFMSTVWQEVPLWERSDEGFGQGLVVREELE